MQALEALRLGGSHDLANRLLELAFREWAAAAELEVLGQLGGAKTDGRPSRGRPPKMMWCSVLARHGQVFREHVKICDDELAQRYARRLISCKACQGQQAAETVRLRLRKLVLGKIIATSSDALARLSVIIAAPIDDHAAHRLHELAGKLEPAVAQARQRRLAARNLSWSTWAKEAMHGSAKAACRHLRPAVATKPAVARLEGASRASTPAALLQAAAKKLTGLWEATCRGPALPPFRPCGAPLQALTTTQIRAAAARFKPGAATTWDGFAPVHYGGLSEHAVSLLAQLYTAVETVGAFPPCVAATSYVLIPKASGGQRPIGMLGSAYRLWA